MSNGTAHLIGTCDCIFFGPKINQNEPSKEDDDVDEEEEVEEAGDTVP